MKLVATVSAIAIAFLVSCSGGRHLKTTSADTFDAGQGSYSVIYRKSAEGGWGYVILDAEGDEYEFIAPGPSGTRDTEEGLSGPEALTRAEEFLRPGGGRALRMKKILDARDAVIGYEISPADQDIFSRPAPNLLMLDYSLGEGGKVRLNLRPLPLMDRSPDR